MVCLYDNQVFEVPDLVEGRFVVTLAEHRKPKTGPFAGKDIFWVEGVGLEGEGIVSDKKVAFAQGETTDHGRYRAEVVGHYVKPIPLLGEDDTRRLYVVTQTTDNSYDGMDTDVIGLNDTREGAIKRIELEFARFKVPFDPVAAEKVPNSFTMDSKIEFDIQSFPIGN